MNRDYLGDALDFWKGAMLDVVRASNGGRRPVKVLPMFTGARWKRKDRDTYLALLRANDADLFDGLLSKNDRVTKAERQAYFDAFDAGGADVFLDPDTGIALSRATGQHVRVDEVAPLVSIGNVVAVYQHRPRGDRKGRWLRRYVNAFPADDGLKLIGYESAQVGMLFVTRSRERAGRLRRALYQRLGPTAPDRVVE